MLHNHRNILHYSYNRIQKLMLIKQKIYKIKNQLNTI